jgi:hypothetical protein
MSLDNLTQLKFTLASGGDTEPEPIDSVTIDGFTLTDVPWVCLKNEKVSISNKTCFPEINRVDKTSSTYLRGFLTSEYSLGNNVLNEGWIFDEYGNFFKLLTDENGAVYYDNTFILTNPYSNVTTPSVDENSIDETLHMRRYNGIDIPDGNGFNWNIDFVANTDLTYFYYWNEDEEYYSLLYNPVHRENFSNYVNSSASIDPVQKILNAYCYNTISIDSDTGEEYYSDPTCNYFYINTLTRGNTTNTGLSGYQAVPNTLYAGNKVTYDDVPDGVFTNQILPLCSAPAMYYKFKNIDLTTDSLKAAGSDDYPTDTTLGKTIYYYRKKAVGNTCENVSFSSEYVDCSIAIDSAGDTNATNTNLINKCSTDGDVPGAGDENSAGETITGYDCINKVCTQSTQALPGYSTLEECTSSTCQANSTGSFLSTGAIIGIVSGIVILIIIIIVLIIFFK